MVDCFGLPRADMGVNGSELGHCYVFSSSARMSEFVVAASVTVSRCDSLWSHDVRVVTVEGGKVSVAPPSLGELRRVYRVLLIADTRCARAESVEGKAV